VSARPLVGPSLLALAALAAAARAEPAWVRGAPLNLRAGAGLEQPVVGQLDPAERVEVIESAGEWTRVRRPDGREGWVAASYLLRGAPPAARIAEVEAEAERLRQELASLGQDADALRERSDADARAVAAREADVERVRRENEALRSGARWFDWITGALILSTGMALGAFLRGFSARQRQSRLRL
jgi:SH3 domain protein